MLNPLLKELHLFILIILQTLTFVILLVPIKEVLVSTKFPNRSLVLIKRALGLTKLFTVLFVLVITCLRGKFGINLLYSFF